jgi:tellurite resistance protein
MTLEFLGDEAVAHLDHQHLVHAKHPIIDRTRDYFAVQVDQHAAEFDNVQILRAVAQKPAEGRAKVEAAVGKYPVEKTLQEQFEIRKTNAHEWYYQRDPAYRGLVQRVHELDEANKQRFPEALRTHKEFKQAILEQRKRLLETDRAYKETLYATHRANRAIDAWLIARQPELDDLPSNRKKASVDQLRMKFSDAPELLALVEKAKQTQAKLEASYPQLFISDEQISAEKRAAADALRRDPQFQRLSRERADAYHAQQDYLLRTDEELKRLDALLTTPARRR